MKHQKILIPLIILLVLLFSWLFRWETEAKKTGNMGVYKWERDRWSNTILYSSFRQDVAFDVEIKKGWIPINAATGIWLFLFTANGIWLYIEYKHLNI